MTSNERAWKLQAEMADKGNQSVWEFVSRVGQAIAAAVEAQKAADAQIAEDLAESYRQSAMKRNASTREGQLSFQLDNRAAWVAEGIANRIRAITNNKPEVK